MRDETPKENGPTDDVEDLYGKLLHFFYDKPDREQALNVAKRLEAVLAGHPDLAYSIRGEEIRSLLAELRGDLTAAVEHRQTEIRKILELHVLAKATPSWEYVVRQYDYGDLSDRLDLLAVLHAEMGAYRRAVEVLQESKHLCDSHQVTFDGADLLAEYSKKMAAQESLT
jgi:hypothetical protein